VHPPGESDVGSVTRLGFAPADKRAATILSLPKVKEK
jgi:hypothetical protein